MINVDVNNKVDIIKCLIFKCNSVLKKMVRSGIGCWVYVVATWLDSIGRINAYTSMVRLVSRTYCKRIYTLKYFIQFDVVDIYLV